MLLSGTLTLREVVGPAKGHTALEVTQGLCWGSGYNVGSRSTRILITEKPQLTLLPQTPRPEVQAALTCCECPTRASWKK